MEKGKVKLTRTTAVLIIVFVALVIAAAVVVRGAPDNFSAMYDASKPEGRVDFLEKLGWEVDPASEEAQEVILPESFGEVLAEYNRLQRQQGFDLEKHAGEKCTQYSYTVLNYPGEDTVIITVYVHGRKIIAGDIHSTAMDGFMHALK